MHCISPVHLLLASCCQGVFETVGVSIVNVFVMTLGEIEFGSNFDELGAFEADAYLLLVIFIFLMPIVLMNLMVSRNYALITGP